MSTLTPQDVAELGRLRGILQGGSHYELFGLKDGFTRDDLKRAYYTLSRRFHPDRFYRQDLGELQSQVEEVFVGINEAYRVLGDEAERARYDRERVNRGGKRPAAPAAPTSGRAGEPPRADAPRAGTPPTAPTPPAAPVSEHVVSFKPRPAPPPPPPTAAPPSEPAKVEKPRIVPPSVDRLKAPFLERLRKARAHAKEGQEAAAAGQWPKAASAFYMAHTFDPKNPDYERLFKDADPKSRRMQAEKLLEQARKVEKLLE